jgi:hypothetical protein
VDAAGRFGASKPGTGAAINPSSTNYWGDDIKVGIPSTGVSISELERFLREKLGHPTHITGEVVRDAKGVSLTARAGPLGGRTVSGSDVAIDELVQKLAESMYGITEPRPWPIPTNR